ncbi:MAG: Essential protein Yae1, N terminal [Piccolia ochrophora]|nr:MAG: Essential protein Yae1, N terminal [Piccolia ochrophora]
MASTPSGTPTTSSTLSDIFNDSRSPSPSAPSPPFTQHANSGPIQSRTPSQSHPSDMPRLHQLHTTAGYREGIAAGKASSMQAGFDEGYAEGAKRGGKVGVVLGVLEGLGVGDEVMVRARGEMADGADEEIIQRWVQFTKDTAGMRGVTIEGVFER